MRSVQVVLPASMWAMMPMFLHLSMGVWRAMISSVLPAVMSESLIGFRHPVGVFLLLYRGAAVVGRFDDLRSQLVDHALLSAFPGVADDPADGQRGPAVGVHFHRHLIVGSANAAGLPLQKRRYGFYRPL